MTPARYPVGAVDPSHFEVVEIDVPRPGPGEVLVRNTFTSVDPGMRLRLRERGPAGYFGEFALHAPMDGILTVGEVVESRAEGFRPGDVVRHASGWREYAVVTAGEPALSGLGTLTLLDTSVAAAPAYLGALGGMGLTAYAGLIDAAQLQRRRRRVGVGRRRSGRQPRRADREAARPPGHRQRGVRRRRCVTCSTTSGSTPPSTTAAGPVVELLREAAPDGIDVYFDSVGGDHLEAALDCLRRRGRVALCGALSEYEADGAERGAAQPVPGDRQRPHAARASAAAATCTAWTRSIRELGGWLAEGRLHYRETIVDGLEHAPEALVRMLAGETVGKTLVRIASDAAAQ